MRRVRVVTPLEEGLGGGDVLKSDHLRFVSVVPTAQVISCSCSPPLEVAGYFRGSLRDPGAEGTSFIGHVRIVSAKKQVPRFARNDEIVSRNGKVVSYLLLVGRPD